MSKGKSKAAGKARMPPRMRRLRKIRDDHGRIIGEVGTGNVWADLGFKKPEREAAKAHIVAKIADVIEERGLTQDKAGRLIGLPQPKLSMLLRGRWDSYSVDRLTRYLNRLGVTVRISFEDRPKWHEGRFIVAYPM